MEILHYGIDFNHGKGEFCLRTSYPYYLLSCFSTPFLYEADGKMLRGDAGDVLIMEPQLVVYHGPIDHSESFVNDWIRIRGDDFEQLLKKYPLPLNKAFPIGSPNLVKKCIQKLMDESSVKQIGYEDKMVCCLTETIIEIHRAYQLCGFSARKSKLATARELFLRNVEKNWSLQEMAQLCGYSASRFSALYKEQFGSSPKADMIQARIERAKRLLSYTDMPIMQIAEQCGFRSIYYFSKYFKETVGMTPSEYAQKYTNV